MFALSYLNFFLIINIKLLTSVMRLACHKLWYDYMFMIIIIIKVQTSFMRVEDKFSQVENKTRNVGDEKDKNWKRWSMRWTHEMTFQSTRNHIDTQRSKKRVAWSYFVTNCNYDANYYAFCNIVFRDNIELFTGLENWANWVVFWRQRISIFTK